MNLLETVEKEVERLLGEMLEAEDRAEKAYAVLEAKKAEFNKVNRAYKALLGDDSDSCGHTSGQPYAEAGALGQSEGRARIPEDQSQVGQVKPVSGPSSTPTRAVPPPKGPTCPGCSGSMYHGTREIRNRIISLWICGDCNNEVPG